MKNKIFKKGELTTQQLVMIIILILSFAIILFFIFRLNLGGTTNKEICHDSVVKKSNAVLGKFTGEIKCKTSYTCISAGEKCDEITATNTVSVDANNKDEIFKAIADEMTNCWWMFGEGKLNYGGGCAICSYIDFDDKVETEEISYKQFLDYLTKPRNIQSSNENYLFYLYGVSSLNSLFSIKPIWKLGYDADIKIPLQGKFIIMTGKVKKGILKPEEVVSPEFPFKIEQIPADCNGNFITQG